MKAVAPVRAALGVRTIFNILGPLANPQQPPLHVIGAYSRDVAQLMAQTLAGLNIERTFVIHGANGWDEPTPIGPFLLFDVRPGRVDVETRDPSAYGFKTCTAPELAGGDAQHNARALRNVLTGEDRGAHRECLLLGAALALECAGVVRNLREGAERAAHAIDSGTAARMLESLAAFGRSSAGGSGAFDAAGTNSGGASGARSAAGTSGARS
jgi:anthranilate phosphoribosyltransferase